MSEIESTIPQEDATPAPTSVIASASERADGARLAAGADTNDPFDPEGKGAGEGRPTLATRIGAALRTHPSRWQPAAWIALAVLLIAGLLMPPISLLDRLATPGYRRVNPTGETVIVPADGDSAAGSLEIPRSAVLRSTRIKLRARDRLPLGVDALPRGSERLGAAYVLDIRGPVPERAMLRAALPAREEDHPLIDPFGWDGTRWRWLAPSFTGPARARVLLPLEEWVPELVVFTRATGGRSEVAAVLEPPPASLPAAAAELPILEVRVFGLADGEGNLLRRPFPPAPRKASIWGVVDNRESGRIRDDLVTNLLIDPGHRRAFRQAVVSTAAQDGLAGIVLDLYGVPDELQAAFADLADLLGGDLEAQGVGLVVVVPPPIRVDDGWDGGAVRWQALGASEVGVRMRLPADHPVRIDALDAMVRWALGRVERRRLQLGVPVHGIDVVDGQATAIGYHEALTRVLDMARSDAPSRISPGSETDIALPTILAAELGRDADTGMWRFYWWDGNRRQHTVWLNDAQGLAPAFEIARRFQLGRLALDGVASGLDPFVWRLVQRFVEDGEVYAPPSSYQLQWRLTDDQGRTIQEAVQPLDEGTFSFRAPPQSGSFQLAVDLWTGDGELAALGPAMDVRIAPPPRPSPTASPIVFQIIPTPEVYETAPPPIDERITRTPVRIDAGTVEAGAAITSAHDAVFDAARGLLRAEPSTDADVLTDLRTGDRMQILERGPDGLWLRVRMLNTGAEGWVAFALVREVEPQAPTERASATPTPRGDPTLGPPPSPAAGSSPRARPTPSATPAQAP